MEEMVQKMDEEMNKALESLKFNFKTIRSGTVSPSILDKIQVLYYGEKMPLKSLASVSAPTPTQLAVKPFDPTASKAIMGALGESDIGVNPVQNGPSIYLTFPPLSGDRRKENVKQAKAYADQAKVKVRNIRGDYVNKLQKDKDFSEDMKFNLKDDIQKETDKFNKDIDTLYAAKEKDLMTI